MPFEILRNDLAHMRVDAIVNTANPRPAVGAGTDAAIHAKAGPQLLEARKQIGDIPVGGCAVTPAFGLEAKYVLHTVGPVWRDGFSGEEALLRQCYTAALTQAVRLGCESVAFPLMCAGTYGFPRDRALSAATESIGAFLLNHEIYVYLVVYDKTSFRISEQLFRDVKSYIDDNYIRRKKAAACKRFENRDDRMETVLCSAARPERSWALEEAEPSLQDLLRQTDEGFSQRLLRLIDERGLKDSQVYTKANISRQHFSKIRNNPCYKPTKQTALALAIALELDLEHTRDLLQRAGYALTKSSKFDVIVMYFIEHGNYNLLDINTALFEFDQSLLGA